MCVVLWISIPGDRQKRARRVPGSFCAKWKKGLLTVAAAAVAAAVVLTPAPAVVRPAAALVAVLALRGRLPLHARGVIPLLRAPLLHARGAVLALAFGLPALVVELALALR